MGLGPSDEPRTHRRHRRRRNPGVAVERGAGHAGAGWAVRRPQQRDRL